MLKHNNNHICQNTRIMHVKSASIHASQAMSFSNKTSGEYKIHTESLTRKEKKFTIVYVSVIRRFGVRGADGDGGVCCSAECTVMLLYLLMYLVLLYLPLLYLLLLYLLLLYLLLLVPGVAVPAVALPARSGFSSVFWTCGAVLPTAAYLSWSS
jgi:hypothetical protein